MLHVRNLGHFVTMRPDERLQTRIEDRLACLLRLPPRRAGRRVIGSRAGLLVSAITRALTSPRQPIESVAARQGSAALGQDGGWRVAVGHVFDIHEH